MKTLPPQDNIAGFWNILNNLWLHGDVCQPRGLVVKELTACNYVLNPRQRFMCFDQRKLRLDYIKQEFLWYLRADRFDRTIEKVASMWDSIRGTDGGFNSNYGQYIFKEVGDDLPSNFDRVVGELEGDPDSRRAVICILDNQHLNDRTSKDYPCTAYLNFQIRANKLNMMVRMRSQDAIFGMGNDAPCFSFTHELMWCALRDKYPTLELGYYDHVADSFHVYQRHFDMIASIAAQPRVARDWHRDCPWMTPGRKQVVELLRVARDPRAHLERKDLLPFTEWLLTRDDPETLL